MALGAIVGSVAVVTAKNPITSVLSLLGSFFCLATIYLLAGFEFIAAAQILVYGGAVMVLFLFVVMLLNLGGDEGTGEYISKRKLPFAFGVGGMLAVLTFAGVLGQDEVIAAGDLAHASSMADLAALMFGSYLLPFEAASILLLAAAVAVMVLAKRQRSAQISVSTSTEPGSTSSEASKS